VTAEATRCVKGHSCQISTYRNALSAERGAFHQQRGAQCGAQVIAAKAFNFGTSMVLAIRSSVQ
jgi:hypothetical protein